jgi:hypothetical protein
LLNRHHVFISKRGWRYALRKPRKSLKNNDEFRYANPLPRRGKYPPSSAGDGGVSISKLFLLSALFVSVTITIEYLYIISKKGEREELTGRNTPIPLRHDGEAIVADCAGYFPLAGEDEDKELTVRSTPIPRR